MKQNIGNIPFTESAFDIYPGMIPGEGLLAYTKRMEKLKLIRQYPSTNLECNFITPNTNIIMEAKIKKAKTGKELMMSLFDTSELKKLLAENEKSADTAAKKVDFYKSMNQYEAVQEMKRENALEKKRHSSRARDNEKEYNRLNKLLEEIETISLPGWEKEIEQKRSEAVAELKSMIRACVSKMQEGYTVHEHAGNFLQDMIGYWEKELNYRMKQIDVITGQIETQVHYIDQSKKLF